MPSFWELHGFTLHIIEPRWEEGAKFAPKLSLITQKIDQLAVNGNYVSLIGQSAGGSAVLNAFCQRRKAITGVINATGRLRAGVKVRPTLESAAKISPAFKESVLLFGNKNESTLSMNDRKKILTLRPAWDEIVPASTVPLKGATNITVPMIEHSIGGVFIVTFYSKLLVNFLRNLER